MSNQVTSQFFEDFKSLNKETPHPINYFFMASLYFIFSYLIFFFFDFYNSTKISKFLNFNNFNQFNYVLILIIFLIGKFYSSLFIIQFLTFIIYSLNVSKENNLRLILFLINFFSLVYDTFSKKINNQHLLFNILNLGILTGIAFLISPTDILKLNLIIRDLLIIMTLFFILWFIREEDEILKKIISFFIKFILSLIPIFEFYSKIRLDTSSLFFSIPTYYFFISRLLDFKEIKEVVKQNSKYTL